MARDILQIMDQNKPARPLKLRDNWGTEESSSSSGTDDEWSEGPYWQRNLAADYVKDMVYRLLDYVQEPFLYPYAGPMGRTCATDPNLPCCWLRLDTSGVIMNALLPPIHPP
jgi:hypothetical protein